MSRHHLPFVWHEIIYWFIVFILASAMVLFLMQRTVGLG